MSHVIIVSNRLPVSVKKVDGELEFSASLGGLATGLSSYVSDGKSIWVGWPGIASEELTEADKQYITIELARRQCAPVFLTRKQISDFYNGYSNSLLWPISHNLPLEPGDESSWWKAYRTANQLFADAVLSLARPNSTIWVHDYQLLLLPELLRAERSGGHIGFFLHIPFPEPAAWRKVKQSKQLLTGMLGADLVGFHTTGYSRNFIACCVDAGLGVAGPEQIITVERTVKVTNFPIGVDYQKYAQAGKLKVVKQAIKRDKKRYGKRKIIVAVDRLEPSKGLVERLKAYKAFLAAHPEQHNKVVMVMVAAPSRMEIAAYQKLQASLLKQAKSINSAYGTATWQPIDLIIEPRPFEEVTALYRIADVAFITPLRDGMNLVAKEYVASKQKGGVLILSQTAGAAEELQDAILVDPTNQAMMVEALEQGLKMSKKELRSRLRSMQSATSGNTIHTWASGFVKALQKPVPGTPVITRSLKPTGLKALKQEYQAARRRTMLLDYDGSLVPLRGDYKNAVPSKKLLETLQALQSDPQNEVVVVSGRSSHDLETWLGHLPISLVAEHGATIRKAGSSTWQNMALRETQWRGVITPLLRHYTELAPQSRLEVKPHSLVWHYRNTPPYYAQKYSVIIKRALGPIMKTYGIKLFQGNKILEIKDPRISKGAAVTRWAKKSRDFILMIGDDFTDEDMFEAAPPRAHTVKVGRGRTTARHRLDSPSDVAKLLSSFTK
jgi:trehalose 6-phosphate synthase/phosphatase